MKNVFRFTDEEAAEMAVAVEKEIASGEVDPEDNEDDNQPE